VKTFVYGWINGFKLSQNSTLKNSHCIELNSMKSEFISVNQLISESYMTTWEDKLYHLRGLSHVCSTRTGFSKPLPTYAYKRHATLNGKKPEEEKPIGKRRIQELVSVAKFGSASTLSLLCVLQIGPRILIFTRKSMLHSVRNPA
jgi:hypothetical protein